MGLLESEFHGSGLGHRGIGRSGIAGTADLALGHRGWLDWMIGNQRLGFRLIGDGVLVDRSSVDRGLRDRGLRFAY